MRRNATAQASQASELISKPKGSVGGAGFSLITEMKLNKQDPKDKVLYNDILVCSEFWGAIDSKLTMGQASVRALAIRAGIDLGRNYKDQSITKLAKLVIAVSAMAKGVS